MYFFWNIFFWKYFAWICFILNIFLFIYIYYFFWIFFWIYFLLYLFLWIYFSLYIFFWLYFFCHLILLPCHLLWSLSPGRAQLVNVIAVSTATWSKWWPLCQQDCVEQKPFITGDWNFIAFLNWHLWPVKPSLHLKEQVVVSWILLSS